MNRSSGHLSRLHSNVFIGTAPAMTAREEVGERGRGVCAVATSLASGGLQAASTPSATEASVRLSAHPPTALLSTRLLNPFANCQYQWVMSIYGIFIRGRPQQVTEGTRLLDFQITTRTLFEKFYFSTE